MSTVKKTGVLRWVMGIALLGACAGCERDFPAPPPLVEIQSIEPSQGFTGDRVTITGSNFDSKLENNIVFFGTVAARLETPTTNASDPNSLVALVPDLADAQDVFIKVSTAAGQTSSTDAFSFLGPGHPRNENLGTSILLQDRPIAVAGIPPLSGEDGMSPRFLVTSQYSHIVRLYLNASSNNYWDFGTGNTPLSAAAFQWKTIDNNQQPITKVEIYLVTLDNAFATSLRTVTFLFNETTDSSLYDVPEMNVEPGLASGGSPDEADFLPWQVRVFAESTNSPAYQVVVTDLYRPKMKILVVPESPESPGTEPYVVDFSQAVSKCMPNAEPSDRLGPIADVIYLPKAKRFYAALRDVPEVFSYENVDGTPIQTLAWSAADGGLVDGIYPCLCSDTFSALAVNQSEQTLYAGYNNQPSRKSFLWQHSIGPQTTAFAQLEAPPYAMTAAMADANSETLYLAVKDGMLQATLGANGNAPPVVNRFLYSQDSLPGTPQALARVTQSNSSDMVLLALSDLDETLWFQAGADSANVKQTPLGNSCPKVAASGFPNMLYLTEPASNVASVINPSSGLRLQIPILDGFYGAKDLLGLFLQKSDVLISPLPPVVYDRGPYKEGYSQLAVRKISSAAEAVTNASDYNLNISQGQVSAVTNNQAGYPLVPPIHDFIPAPYNSKLYLVRYGDRTSNPPKPATIWAADINPKADSASEILTGFGNDTPPLFQVEPGVTMIRLAPREEALSMYEIQEDRQVRLQVKRLADNQTVLDRLLPPPACDYIFDMAVRLSIDNQGSPTVYLSLPRLGQVLEVPKEDQPVSAITTTGSPKQLFLSPDARRLYATHDGQRKVSIIDVDCPSSPNSPTCNQVIRDLTVPFLPDRVTFDQRGEKAFVTHIKGGQITIID